MGGVLRRALLWTAFAVVHLGVAWYSTFLANQPMGDVYNVYEPWSAQALRGGGIVGVTESWVYPQLALVPMVAAWLFAPFGYTPGWAALVILCDALGFAFLVGRGRSRGRETAAWFWIAAVAALGPVAIYRLDAITVPLAIVGCLWLVGRPWLGAAVLAVATWIKVWPAALLAAAVIAVRRRVAIVGGAALVSAVTLGVVVLMGGAAVAFGFVGDQTERGLQLEAPVSTVYVWQALQGVPGAAVYYNQDIITFEVTGPGVDTVISAMTPVLAVAMLVVAALGAWKAWRGASFAGLFPPLALALVLALIVTNKVGSPQYMSWLVPPLVVALVLQRSRWVAPAIVVLVTSVLTNLIYPGTYDGLLRVEVVPVVVLTLRNALLVALFAWIVVRLARVRVLAPRRVPVPQ
jgi:hypothetical protein